MTSEYILAAAAVAAVVLGRLVIVRRRRPISRGWLIVLLVAFGALIGAGGVAFIDLGTRAVGVPFGVGAALLVLVAVATYYARSRRDVHP